MNCLFLPAAMLLSPALLAFGGGAARVEGQLRYTDGRPLTSPVELRLPRLRQLSFTDDTGAFRLDGIPYGRLSVHIYFEGTLSDSLLLSVDDSVVHLGNLPVLNPALRNEFAELPPASEQDLGLPFQDDALQPQAGILLNGRDLFLTHAFSLLTNGYRPRGYNAYPAAHYLGGVWIDESLNQNSSLLWTGLTDIMRNTKSAVNLEAHAEGLGGINGQRSISLHAPYQTPQRKLAYAAGNRSYDHKVQFTYCSELSKKNWVGSVSGFRQWATETYAPGTGSDHRAVYASLAKEFVSGRTFSASMLYHDLYREPRAAATDELCDLAGSTLYNPNWGLQNGVKRSARSIREQLPFAVLEYADRSSGKREWTTAIAFSTRQSAYTGLDWYRAPDPRPDYYRNLPSFLAESNPAGAAALREFIRSRPGLLQVDWQRMYEANMNHIDSVRYFEDNQWRSYTGKQALYVQAADVVQSHNLYFRSHIQQQLGSSGQLAAAFCWNEHGADRYKILRDLLGADYFVDLNDFARRQYPEQPDLWANDLQRYAYPLRKGDRYKYHYRMHARSILSFVQWEQDFRHWTVFGAAEARLSAYSRTGMFTNGLFPDQSFGKGRSLQFLGYQLKAGLTRKLNGRHYLSARFLYGQMTPANVDQVYVAAPIREQIAGDTKDLCPKIASAEFTYTAHAPRFNIQLSAYQTQIWNGIQIMRYYNDEPEFQCFVNMVQRKLAQRHTGLEFCANYVFHPQLSAYVIAATGQSFYTRNPEVFLYSDNDTAISQRSKSVEIAHYYAVTGPQTVAGGGLQIEGLKRWNVRLSFAYMDRNYVRINPARRSAAAAENLNADTPEGLAVFEQERLPPVYSTDIMLSRSFRIRLEDKGKAYQFFCFLNINNVMNRKDQKSFGYEQLRFDFENNDPGRFPNKYSYAPGRTFSMGIQVKW